MDKLIVTFLGALVLVILAISLASLLKGENYRNFQKRISRKTLCSIMFWLFGWIILWYFGIRIGQALFMMLGFTFSVFGDVFLAFKKRCSFIWGLCSFFLAHVFYSMSFVARFGFKTLNMILFAGICGAAIVIFNFTGLFRPDKLRGLSNLYLLVLAFMLGNALSGIAYAQTLGVLVIFTAAGGFLFFLSDFILAYEKFSPKTGLCLEKPVLITYYSAQILLALGMAVY